METEERDLSNGAGACGCMYVCVDVRGCMWVEVGCMWDVCGMYVGIVGVCGLCMWDVCGCMWVYVRVRGCMCVHVGVIMSVYVGVCGCMMLPACVHGRGRLPLLATLTGGRRRLRTDSAHTEKTRFFVTGMP